MPNGNNIRRTITNLRDPQQLRELNRQLEWIWNQLLGGLTDRAFSAFGKTKVTEVVQNRIAENIEADVASVIRFKAAISELMVATIAVAHIDWAQINDANVGLLNAMNAVIRELDVTHIDATTLTAAMADIVSLTARSAVVDYAKIHDLGTDTAIINDGEADTFYIKRLAVTSANLVNCIIGELILKSTDGHYYAVHIGSDGTIYTERVTDPTQSEIDAAVTNDGRQIVETNANISSLNGDNLRYNKGIFGEIVTGALTVTGQLSAVEAFIASADIPELRVAALKGLGDVLDISANDTLFLSAGDDSKGLRRVLRLDSTGVHIGDNQNTAHELLLTGDAVDVIVNGVRYSRFTSSHVQFGNYQLRSTSEGGLAFVLVEPEPDPEPPSPVEPLPEGSEPEVTG